MQNGLLILVTGPSGSGKTTLLNRVLQSDSNCTRVVTCTTRKPRPGEVDGQDYYFLTSERFEELVEAGEFIENANVYGSRYGTLKREILDKLNQGKDVILVVDVQGASTITQKAKSIPELRDSLISIFMQAPVEVLKSRLIRRGKDTPEAIATRMELAKKEMEQKDSFDYTLESGTPEEDHQQMQRIAMAARCPMSPFRDQFIKCSNAGYHGQGPREEITPEMLPLCPSKRRRMLAAGITHLETIACLRFGGKCFSGHPQCQELRRKKRLAAAA
jgi:guanylate kinase